MSLRGMKLLFQVAFCTVVMAGSANAVTVIATENADTGSAVSLLSGGVFTHSASSLAAGTNIGAAGETGLFLNFFLPTAPLGTITVSAQGLLSHIANLTLTWLDSSENPLAGGTLQVTNGAGGSTGAGPLALALTNTGNYFLRITGHVLSNDSTFEVAISTTPIPPALVLFGSALAGLGFLGRRSRRSSASPLA
jgi:hypothetical protein